MTAPRLPHQDDPTFASRYELSASDDTWRRRARDFARDHVAPQARGADRDGRFAAGLVPALGAAGLLGATLPRSVGGGGASHLAGCLIAEEMGAVDGSVRGFLAVHVGLVTSTIAMHGTPAQQETWLPSLLAGEAIGCFALTEEGAGSDPASLATRARPEGDDVVLDGEKIWITNGGVAAVALVFATTDPAKRHRGIECYLVPTDTRGFTPHPMPGRELGHRASNHARIELDGVRVPVASRLGDAERGFAVGMSGLEHGRLNVAAGAVGIQRACLEACVEFARTRRQFGKRIGDFQQVGAAIANMAIELEASRTLTYQAARLRDRGLDDPQSVSAAKLYATEAALRATTKALQIHGARAYTDELPIERHYRDAVALTIYEGTSDIQRLILARGLLGRDEQPPHAPSGKASQKEQP